MESSALLSSLLLKQSWKIQIEHTRAYLHMFNEGLSWMRRF